MFLEGILATLVSTSTAVATTHTSSAVAQAPLEEEKKPELPKKMLVGTQGLFQPGILLQGWYVMTGTDEISSTFRVRRAEMKLQGDIVPNTFSYSVMIDAARVLDPRDTTITLGSGETITVRLPPGSTSPLQDMFVTLKTSIVEASIGQFKTPVSWEGYSSSAKGLFPERALSSTTFGDRRDIGLRLSKTFKYDGRDIFSYYGGIFNGNGQNNLDTNNSKDFTMRLEVYPIKGLMIGGVALSTVGKRDESGSKERYEGDIRFERWGLILQAEYIAAVDVGSGGRERNGFGYYMAGAFKPIPWLQFGLRYGRVDPDSDGDSDPATASGRDEVYHYEGMITAFIEEFEGRAAISLSRFEYDQREDVIESILALQASY